MDKKGSTVLETEWFDFEIQDQVVPINDYNEKF